MIVISKCFNSYSQFISLYGGFYIPSGLRKYLLRVKEMAKKFEKSPSIRQFSNVARAHASDAHVSHAHACDACTKFHQISLLII